MFWNKRHLVIKKKRTQFIFINLVAHIFHITRIKLDNRSKWVWSTLPGRFRSKTTSMKRGRVWGVLWNLWTLFEQPTEQLRTELHSIRLLTSRQSGCGFLRRPYQPANRRTHVIAFRAFISKIKYSTIGPTSCCRLRLCIFWFYCCCPGQPEKRKMN